MYLSCVGSLNQFQSKLDFCEFLKLLKDQAKVPACVYDLWPEIWFYTVTNSYRSIAM